MTKTKTEQLAEADMQVIMFVNTREEFPYEVHVTKDRTTASRSEHRFLTMADAVQFMMALDIALKRAMQAD